MKKQLIILTLFFTSIVFFSCQKKDKNLADQSTLPFFDLKTFFQEEAKNLNERQAKLVKTAFLNGITEEKTFEKVDFNEELKIFREADLNKPAWKDQYKTDTVTNKNGQLEVTYFNENQRLRIKKIVLLFEKLEADKPLEVQIVKQISNPVYETNEELLYQTNQAYQVSSVQKVTFMSLDSVHIQARFLEE